MVRAQFPGHIGGHLVGSRLLRPEGGVLVVGHRAVVDGVCTISLRPPAIISGAAWKAAT